MNKVKIITNLVNKLPWIFPITLLGYIGLQSYLLFSHVTLNVFIFQPSNWFIFIGKCIVFIASCIWLYFSVTKLILIQKKYKELTFRSFLLVFLTCGFIACLFKPIGLLVLVSICLLDRFYSVIMNQLNDMDRLTKWELKKKCPWIGNSGTVADDYEGDWTDEKYDNEFAYEPDNNYGRHQEYLRQRELEERLQRVESQVEYKSQDNGWERRSREIDREREIQRQKQQRLNEEHDRYIQEQQRKRETISYAMDMPNGRQVQIKFEDGHERYVFGRLISSTNSTVTVRDGEFIKVYDIYGNVKQTRKA